MKKLNYLCLLLVCCAISTPTVSSAQTDDNYDFDIIKRIVEKITENEGYKYIIDKMATLKQTADLVDYHLKDRPNIAVDGSQYATEEVWRAPVDAIYYGLGDPRNAYTPYGFSQAEINDAITASDGAAQEKRTGSYVWAMENIDGKIYWGMNHNFLCHAINTGTGQSSGGAFAALNTPYETSCWVCEAENDPRVVESGDLVEADLIWPRSYVYDPATGYVTDISPERDPITRYTQGFRAAGGLNGVAFLCGPDEKFGSSIYAFDTETDQLIASSHFEGAIKNDPDMIVTNMRKFVVLDDVLYLGIAWRKTNGSNGGAILRWYGDKNDPMNFQVVALCEQCAAEITIHKDHLFVGGWVTGQAAGSTGGIYRSTTPYNPETGLTPDNIMVFDRMWNIGQYERNRSNMATQYMGELRSYKGKLYWGTLSAMYTAPFIGALAYQAKDDLETINGILGTLRPTTFWRADFSSATDNDVEMLYGDTEVPAFDYVNHKWEMVSTGYTPTFGRSGFGSLFNNYGAWAMREYNGSLYIGGMDISTLIAPALDSSLFCGSNNELVNMVIKGLLAYTEYKDPAGYNLYRLDEPDEPVKCITNDGFGNPYAYGIRNFAYLDDQLVIGTANPQTLSPGAGGQVLLFNTDNGEESYINAVLVPMSVYMRQENGYIHISSVDQSRNIDRVELYNTEGCIVASIDECSHQAVLSTCSLPAGIYILRVQIGTENFTRKVAIR